MDSRQERVELALRASLGARLRTARLSARVTQAELAKVAGLTRSSIANIETGRYTPSVPLLVVMALELQVDPGALIGFGPTAGLIDGFRLIAEDIAVHDAAAERAWRQGDTVEALQCRGAARGLRTALAHVDAAMAEARTAWQAVTGLSADGA